MEQHLDAYCMHLRSERQVSPHTLEAYRRDLDKVLAFCKKNQLSSWTSLDIQHLRSFTDVQDYKLRSGDMEVGKVTDFVLNPENWTVPYAVVELHDEGRQVLLPTEQISKIGFPDKILETEVMLDALRQAQPYEA